MSHDENLKLKELPLDFDVETKAVLKSLPSAHAALAELYGIKYSCGNDIWVVGSASVGNSCFTCITGESYPIDDYEIDKLLKRQIESNKTPSVQYLYFDQNRVLK